MEVFYKVENVYLKKLIPTKFVISKMHLLSQDIKFKII